MKNKLTPLRLMRYADKLQGLNADANSEDVIIAQALRRLASGSTIIANALADAVSFGETFKDEDTQDRVQFWREAESEIAAIVSQQITPAGKPASLDSHQWAIVETWNGEGYSCGENRAELFNGAFDQARAEARRKAREMEIGEYLEREDSGAFLISYASGDSQGTIQAIPFGPDHVGVVIYCNINEAKAVTAPEWAFELNQALAQANPGETEPDLAPFVGAYSGDVDYQFVALNMRCEACKASLESSCGDAHCRICGKPTPDFAQY